jgi:membrane protein implicated in regulation of membrane protease activity
MRPIENILALIAAVLVAGAVFPWSLRLACALAAVGVLLIMIVNRYRAHTAKVQKRRVLDVYAAVDRLRSERKARFEQGRPRRRSG